MPEHGAGVVQLEAHARIDTPAVRAHDDAAQKGLVDVLVQHDLHAQFGFGFLRNNFAQVVIKRHHRGHVDHGQVELAAQLLFIGGIPL